MGHPLLWSVNCGEAVDLCRRNPADQIHTLVFAGGADGEGVEQAGRERIVQRWRIDAQ